VAQEPGLKTWKARQKLFLKTYQHDNTRAAKLKEIGIVMDHHKASLFRCQGTRLLEDSKQNGRGKFRIRKSINGRKETAMGFKVGKTVQTKKGESCMDPERVQQLESLILNGLDVKGI
jgi:hypothetical protein